MMKSDLLMYLLKNAEAQRIDDGVEMFSANYLFASIMQVLLDKVENKIPNDNNNKKCLQELECLQLLLNEYHLDYEKIITDIHKAVNAKRYDPAVDGFRFGKMYYDAEAKAKQIGKETIDTTVFVSMILEEPTAIICKCLDSNADLVEDEGLDLDDFVPSMQGRQMLLNDLKSFK